MVLRDLIIALEKGTSSNTPNADLTSFVNTFTSSLSGAAPASGGGTANFLRADGTWAAPSGGSANVTPDTHPASPTIYDDEFEENALDTGGTRVPSANPWVWFNQGTATIDLKQGAAQIVLNDMATNIRYIAQTVPVGTWTFDAKLAWLGIGPFNAGGIVLYNSGNGKIVMMEWLGSSTATFVVDQWTNNTTFSSRPGFSAPPFPVSGNGIPAYIRTVYDGTNYKFSVAPAGYNDQYFQGYSQAVATFLGAITHIGIGSIANTSSAGASLCCDWFRRTA
jgi:hypothetical protein